MRPDQRQLAKRAVAGTVGMAHSGTLGGVFRQTVGDNKWQKLGGGLPEDVIAKKVPYIYESAKKIRDGIAEGTLFVLDRAAKEFLSVGDLGESRMANSE